MGREGVVFPKENLEIRLSSEFVKKMWKKIPSEDANILTHFYMQYPKQADKIYESCDETKVTIFFLNKLKRKFEFKNFKRENEACFLIFYYRLVFLILFHITYNFF